MLGQPNTGDGFYDLIRQGNRVEQLYRDAALSNPLERQSLFGKGHVDINDNMRAFVQANYVRAKNDTFSAGPPPAVGAAWGGAIPNTPGAPNTAIPAGLQSAARLAPVRCRRRGPGFRARRARARRRPGS